MIEDFTEYGTAWELGRRHYRGNTAVMGTTLA